ncbi:MAG: CPBP family intramembrane metalloprotease [Proteobacteria bacterium]|nr:CPBP family intramembrane metalloprotease [Pseudomonadota bacterium]
MRDIDVISTTAVTTDTATIESFAPSRHAASPGIALRWVRTRPAPVRVLLGIECAVLFGALPLAYATWGVGRVPLMPALWAAALYCSIVLYRDAGFDRSELSLARLTSIPWTRMLALFAISAACLTAAVAWFTPANLFDLPRQETGLWLAILITYPLLSVIPQELVWRTFFMHRYRDLLPSPNLRIAASAAAFGFGHIVFLHWIPVVLTAFAGAIFARTYLRDRSLWSVSAEHALYGCLMFTIGLGGYFSISQVAGTPSLLP